jgi:hypothetical protein
MKHPRSSRVGACTILLTLLVAAGCGRPQPAAQAPAHLALDVEPHVGVPTWAGERRWAMRDVGSSAEPDRLALGFTALPNGAWSVTGTLLLDDAELGAVGSARLRNGRLVVDLVVNGGVADMPVDAGKQALFAPGAAPATVSSAGFATMRLLLDPATLAGSALRYQVNVVQGDKVQGPMYADSTLTPEPAR